MSKWEVRLKAADGKILDERVTVEAKGMKILPSGFVVFEYDADTDDSIVGYAHRGWHSVQKL